MNRFVLLLSFLGILLVAGCGKNEGIGVYTAENKRVGTIEITDEHNARYLNNNGEERGKVRGPLVRDESGARLGTIVSKDGHWVILDAAEDEIGTVENGMDCYGKGKAVVGRMSEQTDMEAAGAACLIFFLR